jgi:hypothetical protein
MKGERTGEEGDGAPVTFSSPEGGAGGMVTNQEKLTGHKAISG